MKKDGIETVHVVDVTDYWLSKRIAAACQKYKLTLTAHESPLFILPKSDAIERYKASKKHLAKFYQSLRIDKNVLLTDAKQPVGGQWSFDAENRKKLPKDVHLPDDPLSIENADVTAATVWLQTVKGEHYGEAAQWLPYTHATAEAWFQTFLHERFANFGTYEDALSTTHTLLFHSALSPLINIGLLTPQYVLDETLGYTKTHQVPINSLEGFVRQILGWREFIRAAYECDGVQMRTKNFWQHTRALPQAYWKGETSILPVDTAIHSALRYGYNHHIERLMVLGNVMLLSKIHPDEVYRWFMAMYVDAYDWVMVPNVYGMSQFADGGVFATKPYISGSNYIKKMSHYQGGKWEDIWTALYWNFIETHQAFFMQNHRLSMMPRLLAKMDSEKRKYYQNIAKEHLGEM
jgi:deoxyribodipyrimidine photolyase-related protein